MLCATFLNTTHPCLWENRDACTWRILGTWSYETVLLRKGVQHTVCACVCGRVMLMVSWERMSYLRLKLDCSKAPGAEADQQNPVWRGANKHAPLPAHFKPQQGYFSRATSAGLLHQGLYEQETVSQLTYVSLKISLHCYNKYQLKQTNRKTTQWNYCKLLNQNKTHAQNISRHQDKQQLQANYQRSLGRGFKALSSPFWQETLRWCAKWVKAHPKPHNRFGLPLLLTPSPSVCQNQPRGVPQNTVLYLGRRLGRGSCRLNRKDEYRDLNMQLNLGKNVE